ncbi:MAG: hypothetical protein GXO49_00840 [Chlorobi bacterium]|nr:hypothetical protein [Chlorobiota bacterium]
MLGEKLKFLSEYDWATIWPKISVVLFTLIFLFIVYMAITFKKKDIEEWEAMPLNDGAISDDKHSNKD